MGTAVRALYAAQVTAYTAYQLELARHDAYMKAVNAEKAIDAEGGGITTKSSTRWKRISRANDSSR